MIKVETEKVYKFKGTEIGNEGDELVEFELSILKQELEKIFSNINCETHRSKTIGKVTISLDRDNRLKYSKFCCSKLENKIKNLKLDCY